MGVNMNHSKPNYVIHCIYAGAFLLSIFFYVSYQIWDRVQLNNEINAKNEERRINQAAQILKERKQKEIISSCLMSASNLYIEAWSDACSSQNHRIKNAYETCLRDAKAWSEYIWSHSPADKKKLYTYKINECKSLYQFTNKANPNCTLPKLIAKGLNKYLSNLELRCRENA